MLHHARQECAIQSQLLSQNVVSLWNYTENEQEITIYMEFCNEAKFFETRLIEQHKELKDEGELKDFVYQILIGLKFIHDHNIIHADMKPHNILLHRPTGNDKAVIKICDFGISLVINPNENNGLKKALMKQRSGTAGYIAPEIKANNELVGPEIDIWAMGVIIYEMSVGYKPT
jgi:serine/threonine protein kinase